MDSSSPQVSIPLYLRHSDPTVRPIVSHNALTHNVVVKVTVPKRTGRKRKRGTDGPFEGPIVDNTSTTTNSNEEVFSRDRLDAPRILRRKLSDNVGKYTVEPIGVVTNTHRYRGLADFQYAMGNSPFMSRFVDQVLPGDVAKLKEFAIQPGIESGKNIDLIPPPNFTPMSLPFQYGYAQNPYTKEISPGTAGQADDDGGNSDTDSEAEFRRVVNVTSRVPAAGYFIAHDEYPVPSAPRRQPNLADPQVALIMKEMWAAMEERPIWTRRSMWNRLGSKFASLPKSGSLVRHCLQYAGYQFKGGPWRDALVKYGLDPRSDPKYRIYQTLIFKLHKTRIGTVGREWKAVRRSELGVTNFGKYWNSYGESANLGRGPASERRSRETHVFTGESFSTDGKVWQVCDITDPLLRRLFENAEVRPECDTEISGFYHRVLWSVAKAIMKCKMLAIRFGRTLSDDDFGATLEAVKGPNDGGDGGSGTSIGITLPDLQLTAKECEQLRGRNKIKPGLKQGRDRWEERKKKTHYRVRIPLKEVEEREAEKMALLLGIGLKPRERRRAPADGSAAGLGPSAVSAAAAAAAPGAEVDEEVPLDPALASIGGGESVQADATTTTTDTTDKRPSPAAADGKDQPATTKTQQPRQDREDEEEGEEEEEEVQAPKILQDIFEDNEDEEEYEGLSEEEEEEGDFSDGDLLGDEDDEDDERNVYDDEEDDEEDGYGGYRTDAGYRTDGGYQTDGGYRTDVGYRTDAGYQTEGGYGYRTDKEELGGEDEDEDESEEEDEDEEGGEGGGEGEELEERGRPRHRQQQQQQAQWDEEDVDIDEEDEEEYSDY